MMNRVELEINDCGNDVIFNIIFSETGEIRQKRRSREWVLRRIFQSELKTKFKKYDEILTIKE